MKKFTRNRSLDELLPLLNARGIELDTGQYDRGSDWVTLSGAFGGFALEVIYCPFNGHFFGRHGKRVFSERTTELDAEPWYADLLDLFFIGEEEPAHV